MIQIVQVKPPKLSSPNLVYTKDTYVVQNGLLFDYYPIKTKPLISYISLSIQTYPALIKGGDCSIENTLPEISGFVFIG